MYIVIDIETILAGSKSIARRSEGVNIKPKDTKVKKKKSVLKRNLKEGSFQTYFKN